MSKTSNSPSTISAFNSAQEACFDMNERGLFWRILPTFKAPYRTVAITRLIQSTHSDGMINWCTVWKQQTNVTRCTLCSTPPNHVSPAGVRWSHYFVPGIRGFPSSLHLDSVLDVVGVHPVSPLHGVHRRRHEVMLLAFPWLGLAWHDVTKL